MSKFLRGIAFGALFLGAVSLACANEALQLQRQDRKFLQNIVPGLSKTPQGNKMLIETQRRLAPRDQEVAAIRSTTKLSTVLREASVA